MKRKIFFSIVFILNILISFYVIFNVNNVAGNYIANSKDTLNMYNEVGIEISEESFYSTINALYITQMIVSVLSLIYIFKENILRKKALFAIILFIFALNNFDLNIVTVIVGLIDLFYGFALLIIERKTEDDFPIKRKLPLLDVVELKKYQKICMYILMLLYFILFILPTGDVVSSLDSNTRLIINIALYVILSLFTIFIFKDKLKRDFKHLFKNFYDYLVPSFKIFFITIIAYFVASYVLHFIVGMPLPKNEESIEQLNIFLVLFAGCIYAPLVEENIFRNSLHYVIKNNTLFVIISALAFGLLHTFDEANIAYIILQAVPYSIIGLFMSYNYAKTNNIAHTMMWHFGWNLITTLITASIR